MEIKPIYPKTILPPPPHCFVNSFKQKEEKRTAALISATVPYRNQSPGFCYYDKTRRKTVKQAGTRDSTSSFLPDTVNISVDLFLIFRLCAIPAIQLPLGR